MGVLYRYFRISKPSAEKLGPAAVPAAYRKLRNRTFWGVASAYCLYYVCRMALSVVKQPVIDSGILSAGQLGIIGSALLFAYAFGKFVNGFIADYCNIKRFMGVGLLVSSLLNLVMGALGLLHGWLGLSSVLIFIAFALMWCLNGWAQSMGAPPAVISLSRWFSLKTRGTWYSIICSTPYLGKALSLILIGGVVAAAGWQWGFIFAAITGVIGAVIIFLFVSDTPESKGLPSVQELSGEEPAKGDSLPTKELQRLVIRHPGIWVIALSCSFVYITQYGLSNWGVLFLQKGKGFSLTEATWVIGFSEAFGVVGTVLSGWLSDKVFKGDRVRPVFFSGLVCLASLCAFMFLGGSSWMNVLYVGLFSLSIGVVYCIVGGLMALDIVPRRATGAALGIVGISSYVAAGAQDIVSGFLIQGGSEASGAYDFTSVAIFWLAACLIAIILPLLSWKHLRHKIV